MLNRRFVFTCLFILYSLSAFSESDIKFYPITSPNKLFVNYVNCITQDKLGLIWFGTDKGLYKYDGNQFTNYTPITNDTNSINDIYISYLFEDKDGSLWIGTANGLARYNREMDNFKQYIYNENNSNGISSQGIGTITQLQNGELWIGSYSGIDIYNKKKNSFSHINKSNGLSGNIVFNIIEKKDEVWIATVDGTLDCFNKTTKTITNIPIPVKNKSTIERTFIQCMIDDGEEIWIGTNNSGLYKLNCRTKDVMAIITNKELDKSMITAFTLDKLGNLWIGTENAGLYIYNKNEKRISIYLHDINDRYSLLENSIKSLYTDRKGAVWLGFCYSGLSVYDKDIFRFKLFQNNQDNRNDSPLSHNVVTGLVEDKQHNIFIGMDGGGINIFNPRNKHSVSLKKENSNLPTNEVVGVTKDKDGVIWAAVYGYGIIKCIVESKQITTYKISSKPISIYYDKSHKLWISTFDKGLVCFDIQTGLIKSYLNEKKVNSLIIDNKGLFWIARHQELLCCKYDSNLKIVKTFTNDPKNPNGIPVGNISCIFEDSQKNLWLGINNQLYLYNKTTNHFVGYKLIKYSQSDIVSSILEDKQGLFWISTTSGVIQFNPQSKAMKKYDIEDGLQSNLFQKGSSLLTSDGIMYFGGINGLNAFNPDSITENKYIPPIILTDFQLFYEPVKINRDGSPLKKHISVTSKIILNYKQSVFTIGYAALNYCIPKKNQYAYKLEGFDKEWNYVGTERKATYTNLNAGTYVFKVKGSNNDGVWNEKGRSLTIVILPPFWKTWWAYLIYISIISSLFLLILHLVRMQERYRQKLSFERLKMNQQHEIDSLKLNFYTNISHELRTPITLILGPVESIIKSGYKLGEEKTIQMVEIIHRNSKRLLNLVNQILEVRKLETGNLPLQSEQIDILSFLESTVASFKYLAEQKQIDLSFNANIDSTLLWVDKNKIEKVFINLLSNAFKFTEEGGLIAVKIEMLSKDKNIEFEINNETEYIVIHIEDNGIGIPDDEVNLIFNNFYQARNNNEQLIEGSGIGLHLCKEFVTMHSGFIFAKSILNKGSVFTILLPQGKTHLKPEELIYDDLNKLPDQPNEQALGNDIENELPRLLVEKNTTNTVLIVEDNADMRAYIISILQPHYNIVEAADGNEGLAKAIKIMPTLIISDVMMPGMNGIELCNKIKTTELTSHIPVILLTAKTATEAIITGFETGADDYVTKPFDAEILKARVVNLISSRTTLRNKFGKQIKIEPSEVTVTSIDEKILTNAISIVDKNIDNQEFNIEIFSKAMNMSRVHLYRKLFALTGMSPSDFVRNLRIKRARHILDQSPGISVNELADMVGYKYRTYFTKCFQEQFNMTPTEYSKKVKENK